MKNKKSILAGSFFINVTFYLLVFYTAGLIRPIQTLKFGESGIFGIPSVYFVVFTFSLIIFLCLFQLINIIVSKWKAKEISKYYFYSVYLNAFTVIISGIYIIIQIL